MQKSDNRQTATSTHRKVQSSTTLNRKYVKRPTRSNDVTVSIRRSPKVTRFGSAMEMPAQATQQTMKEAEPAVVAHPVQVSANKRMQVRANSLGGAPTTYASKVTAKELKEQAIQKALAAANKTTEEKTPATEKVKKKMHFGFGRVILALSCAAVAVFAIVYFVNLNMPDLSLRVAAMQSGINASYPSYVPRDFNLSDITSEEGKVVLNFKNSATDDAFSLVEETSSWDSNALLANYVKDAYGENYTVIREQGITLYISGSNASWVNGGVVYKLTTTSGSLTKKQIKSIAVSL